jgi:murein DD-endopeptidase MepM/ murein hydrolase activator NlpD
MFDNGRWLQRALSGAMLVAALAVVLIAGRIVFDRDEADPAPPRGPDVPPAMPLGIADVDYATPPPTALPDQQKPPVDWVRPTADPDAIAAALDAPVVNAPGAGAVYRAIDPLTILPARSRSEIVTYRVKPDDTLGSIAQQFGLQESTLIWSNDRFYVNAMRIGMEMTILPVDGVYHQVDEPTSITSLAEMYDVDPYAIIDSEYNNLFGAVPNVTLPEGLRVVVPGGTGSTEPIYWDPGIVITNTDGSNPVGTGVNPGATRASFAVGDPGSCGEQAVVGGSPPVSAPIYANYRITQDFNWTHGGIDLAVPPGTPVFAAGGGTVIFKGWSTWGYGYTVVIAHGGTLSVYGHLNGDFVSCGQTVTAGQNIAVSGNSGRSSGPHLHFEIRGPGGAPANPWDFQSF